MEKSISRKKFLKAAALGAAGFGAASALGIPAFAAGEAADFAYDKVDPALLMTEAEGVEWHEFKSTCGPLYPGYAGFDPFMNFVKDKLSEYGCVDFLEHHWTHNTYYVNDWPDHNNGSMRLISDGTEVPVGTFLQLSPSTGEAGITAEMVYYDVADGEPAPGAFRDKIVVMRPIQYMEMQKPFTADFLSTYVVTDTNYRSEPDIPAPMLELVDPRLNCSWNTRWEFYHWMATLPKYANIGEASGLIIASGLTYGCLEGLYERQQVRYGFPSLVIDCKTAEKVMADAKAGKTATMTLISEFFDAEAWNFLCFLPGTNYGTDADEYITINIHTDAMSLTQDNGALGALGVCRYFSRIPQENRAKTLVFCIDSRHFIEGWESGNFEHDPYQVYPEVVEKVSVTVGLEHMGEMEGALDFENNAMVPTGRPEFTFMVADDNDWCARTLIQAAIDSGLERADIKIDGRPGIHGLHKGTVRAAQARTHKLGVCVIGQAGNWCGAHTQTFSTMQYFGAKKFRDEVHLWTQVISNMMGVDSIVYDIVWSKINTAIRALEMTDAARSGMLGLVSDIFANVVAGDYAMAAGRLDSELRKAVSYLYPDMSQAEELAGCIEQAKEKLLRA